MKICKLLVPLVILLAPAVARADARAGTSPLEPLPSPAPPQVTQRSESTALLLSLGGTLVGWSLVGMGVAWRDNDEPDVIGPGPGAGSPRPSTTADLAPYALWGGLAIGYLGPSFGHWYSGSIVSRGLGVRTVGLASFIAALSKTDLDECDPNDFSCDGVAATLFWAGVALYAAGTIDDIVFAPRKVRKRNLWMAPRATSRGGGFALGGRF